MRFAPLALALLVTSLPLASSAQSTASDTVPTVDEQILLNRVMNDKRSVYAQNLNMTEAESKAFWPVYDEYEAALKKLDDRFIALVNEFAEKYDSLTDKDAKSMLDEKMTIEAKRMALKQEYTKKIERVLPPVKALRYSQLETRIEILVRRNVYGLIPLAR
jgi:Spy/CpxP family protein refolding chaperone